VLFLDPCRRKVNHHTLLWNFDVSGLDHEELARVKLEQKGDLLLDPRVNGIGARTREGLRSLLSSE